MGEPPAFSGRGTALLVHFRGLLHRAND